MNLNKTIVLSTVVIIALFLNLSINAEIIDEVSVVLQSATTTVAQDSIFVIDAMFTYEEEYYGLYGSYVWLYYSVNSPVTTASRRISYSFEEQETNRPEIIYLTINTTYLGLVEGDTLNVMLKCQSAYVFFDNALPDVYIFSEVFSIVISEPEKTDLSFSSIVVLLALSTIVLNVNKKRIKGVLK